ncbi:MAG: hypothetical protein U0793_19780 [Gemmataceae bacterium]
MDNALPLVAPPTNRFSAYADSVETLLQLFPGIYQLLHPGQQVSQIESWPAMVQRFEAFQAQGRQPVLVATLFGPTGAGKSTLFRLLTGVDVPAGDVVRPMSYACAVAVPQAWDDPARLRHVFPRFQLEPLRDPLQLRQPDDRPDRLFHVGYPESNRDELPLILADVPDFDSVEQKNWTKAEYMLQRAEVVVFLVYGEGYANEAVVRELARGCRIAARLAYLFTKTPTPEHARKKWEHLLQTLRRKQTMHAEAFQEQRSDGRTLLDFLESSPVYFSPRRDAPSMPSLEDIQPVEPATPPLSSLLRGLDAENLLLTGLLEPTGRVVKEVRRELGTVRQKIDLLKKHLDDAKKVTDDVAERIAGSEFPLTRMMQIVLGEARQSQNWVLKGVMFPFRWLRGMIGGAIQSGKNLINVFRGAEMHDEMLTRQQLEERRLGEGVEHLINVWRGDWRSVDPHFLEQARIAQMRERFKHVPPPEPGEVWESHVRREVQVWAKAHPWLCDLLPSVGDALAVLGGTVFVIDLFATGGIFHVAAGGIGVVGAAAAGGVVAGVFLQWIERWQLGAVLKVADKQWREQRSGELKTHLVENFYRPMFHPWFHLQELLEKAPVKECAAACTELEHLFGETRAVSAKGALTLLPDRDALAADGSPQTR